MKTLNGPSDLRCLQRIAVHADASVVWERAKQSHSPTVREPCVRDCCLDHDDVCLGCFRSLTEILAWHRFDPEERHDAIERAKARRTARA